MKTDPLLQYVTQLIEDWEEKLQALAEDENRYRRRQAAAQRQLSYLKVKLGTIKENRREFDRQLTAAKRKLTEIKA